MAEFFDNALTLPTGFWSVLLGLVLLYWLMVILGALDLDFLDGVLDLELLDSVDGVADGAFEGAADGALEGAGEGVDAPEGNGGGGLASILSALGLAGVPLTVSLSLLVFLGWFLTYLGMELWSRFGTAFLRGFWAAAIVAVASLTLAVFMTAQVVKPLRGVFRTVQATSRHQLVGRVCTLTTQSVDDTFGQAEVDDGGSAVLVQVRCPAKNDLTRGSQALVFNYDPEREVFLVAPLDVNIREFLADEA